MDYDKINLQLSNLDDSLILDEETFSVLKDSTKKLLYLLEELQKKTQTKIVKFQEVDQNDCIKVAFASIPADAKNILLDSDKDGLNELENKTKRLEYVYIENDHDDCTVYKKLTRHCSCLKTPDYNDLVIQFNENTKHVTTNNGEIIKNIRLVKKFLYMGAKYTKNALVFLNDGLKNSSHTERVEIIQGCSFADICNVFDDESIVKFCICYPVTSPEIGDKETQMQAAVFIHGLSELEEGRRYLSYSTKIMGEIKKTLRKYVDNLDYQTLELLNTTLNTLQPNKPASLTYYCKQTDEGMCSKTVHTLAMYRQYMTLEEICMHLDLLTTASGRTHGKEELLPRIPLLIKLFKKMLVEYDNSDVTKMCTAIMSNLFAETDSKDVPKPKDRNELLYVNDMAIESKLPSKDANLQFPGLAPHVKSMKSRSSRFSKKSRVSTAKMSKSANLKKSDPKRPIKLDTSPKIIRPSKPNPISKCS